MSDGLASETGSERKTVLSDCRKYRYTLWREWMDDTMFDGCNEGERGKRPGEYLMVIGLNPSTADETKDDPTIRKCIGFAKIWGFGALCMANLFAWRDTKPENMKKAMEPIGEHNDLWLESCAKGAGMILAAWGKNGTHMGRDLIVKNSLPAMHCLKINGDGTPMHPLYVPYETRPIRF